jgi:uncharacterized membrane protein
MNYQPDASITRWTRGLGVTSLALAVAPLVRTETVARLTGTDDSTTARAVIGAVGARELAHAVALLAGPPAMVWTRVLGDAADLTLLERARRARGGARRRRTTLATAAVAGIAAVDAYAAVRSARHRQHGRGRPGPLHLEASVTVNKPVGEVYRYWRDFENLPSFMLHLQSVTADGDGRSHWKANAPVKRSVEWDAEMTGDEPNRRISWKSLPKSGIDNSGTVHFATTPDGRGTEVRVTLHYDVPGGALGRAVAKLWGEEPEQQVRDELRRFKQVMETGQIVRSDGLPEGTDARHQMAQRPAQPPKEAVLQGATRGRN